MTITDSDHPDIPWKVPERLPPVPDLRVMLGRCEMVLSGEVTPTFARQCIAKLMVAFEPNTKLGPEETRMRAAVWLEACADMNDMLWADATVEAIRAFKWMPKPSEFRAIMQAHVDMAKRREWKIREMLAAHERPQAKAYKPEPAAIRIRGMRDSFRRVGMLSKAVHYERELAGLEKREPEEWAKGEVAPTVEQKAERPPFKPDASPSALRCAELARLRRQSKEPA